MLKFLKRQSTKRKLCRLCRKYSRDFDEVIVNAARSGHSECVEVLIEEGADVEKPDEDGRTALMWAAERGRTDCVRILIDVGAEVNRCCKWDDTALIHASRRGHDSCAQLLISAGADVNRSDRYCNSILMNAAGWGNDKCVDLLIKSGANVNVVNKYHETALSHGAGSSNLRCVKLLLRAGAYVNNTENQNALQHHLCEVTKRSHSPDKTMVMLLFAAGETIDSSGLVMEVESHHGTIKQVLVPDYLKSEDLELNLKHLCRETLRKHLLKLSPVNLFCRVPQLGLPKPLQEYLLFYESL